MARYLIEIHHADDHDGCVKALHAIETHGSHFVTQADWGCEDGDHTAWMIVDATNKEEATQIVPPPFRVEARVVRLTKFTMEGIDRILQQHSDPGD